MKNVLVTGGAGFIGSNFINHLLRHDPNLNLITLDALTYAGNLDNLSNLPDPSRHTFIQGDILDSRRVERMLVEHEVDTIVNFAAETHVDRSIFGAAAFIKTNVMGTYTLLEVARKVWLEDWRWGSERCRFHHISTDEVYGSLDIDDPPFREEMPYSPNSPYAASKAAADHLVRAYAHTHGLPTTLTNCTNNYGPNQYPEKLIPLMVLNALEGKPLPIYGDGKQIRDWLYVDDHVVAVKAVLERGEVGETYNIGGGEQRTNRQIVEQICDLLDDMMPESMFIPHSALMEFVADRPGHDRRYAMDIRKIDRDLGWRPNTSFDDGLHMTIRWYLDNPEWVRRIRSKHDYQDWLSENYSIRGGVS